MNISNPMTNISTDACASSSKTKRLLTFGDTKTKVCSGGTRYGIADFMIGMYVYIGLYLKTFNICI